MLDSSSISINNLADISLELRKRIIYTSSKKKIPHLGSCLSCIEILVYLYWIKLRIDPINPQSNMRDRFILSKGHAAPALFQVLAMKGFFSEDSLELFGESGSVFHEHPPRPGYIPGIEAATGSLGHGLPMALGMALSARVKNQKFNCYALISDGECNEGSIWESAMMASAQNVDNLIVIIDYNKWQATGRSNEIMSLDPLKKKWDSFGWNSKEISGHNFHEIDKVFRGLNKKNGKPSVIIANTIKGKGISFMEDNNNWHYRTPNEEELELAIQELEKAN